MSRQYKDSAEVPTQTIVGRIEQLSNAVTEGRDSINREFTMRVPAEVDRDADLVLSEAAKRIKELETYKEAFEWLEDCDHYSYCLIPDDNFCLLFDAKEYFGANLMECIQQAMKAERKEN